MNWFKQLLKSKIHITIITPPPEGVSHSTKAKVIEIDSPNVRRKTYSNLRFIEEHKTDCFGEASREVYFTEEYVGGKWSTIIDSISCDKDKAMDLHMKLLEAKTLEPEKIKTVLWEGLNVDEARTWVTLNK